MYHGCLKRWINEKTNHTASKVTIEIIIHILHVISLDQISITHLWAKKTTTQMINNTIAPIVKHQKRLHLQALVSQTFLSVLLFINEYY